MKSAIELHDSECLAIEIDSRGNGVVILDACVLRTDGEPGIARGEGGAQRVRITIESMTLEGDIGPFPALINDGGLDFGGTRLNGLIPLPSFYEGHVNLTLIGRDNGRAVSVTGKSASITEDGPFRFVEQFDPR